MIHEKDKPAFEAMISEALQSLDDDLPLGGSSDG